VLSTFVKLREWSAAKDVLNASPRQTFRARSRKLTQVSTQLLAEFSGQTAQPAPGQTAAGAERCQLEIETSGDKLEFDSFQSMPESLRTMSIIATLSAAAERQK
jgi:hypothetical protein